MKYKIGVVIRRILNGKNSYLASCNCGVIGLRGEENSSAYTCEGCGNKEFIYLGYNHRKVHPYMDILYSTRKGFKAKRTNLSLFYDQKNDDYTLETKTNTVKVLAYDRINKTIKIYKGKKVILSDQHEYEYDRKMGQFFSGVDHNEFVESLKNEETGYIYRFMWNKLSSKNSYYGYDKRIGEGLKNLFKYDYMEILANAGYPNLDRFHDRYYNSRLDLNGTNPAKILQLPKFFLQYIRENEDVSLHDIGLMQDALKKVETNKFKEMLEIVRYEGSIRELCRCVDTIAEIHDKYKYNNMRKLTLYLFREIKMNQGITDTSSGATLLRDYLRMSIKLGLEYEKYPKSLKKEHDILQMNYKVQENEMKKKSFLETITAEDYKNFEYKPRKDELAIITPSEMGDLIKEGNELSHCVASYVDAVISKNCKIFFLRKKDMLDQPLATVEVRGRAVRQARGFANRALTTKEREFVSKWANKKELEVKYYY